eukprot:7390567-Prymnesium_polylepis.3
MRPSASRCRSGRGQGAALPPCRSHRRCRARAAPARGRRPPPAAAPRAAQAIRATPTAALLPAR